MGISLDSASLLLSTALADKLKRYGQRAVFYTRSALRG